MAEITLVDEMSQPEIIFEQSSSTNDLLVDVQQTDQMIFKEELIDVDIIKSTEPAIELDVRDSFTEQAIDIEITTQPETNQTGSLPVSDSVSDKEILRETEIIISKNDTELMISITDDNDLPEPSDSIIKTFDSASSGN